MSPKPRLFGRLRELEASERELQATVAELAVRLTKETGVLLDLPAAAREHLARDAEREQALVRLREDLGMWVALSARRALEPPDA